MTHASVTIQIAPPSAPSIPSWLAEVAAVAQLLSHVGILKAIQQRVRFARARFGHYEVIDFVVVLIGYALSGEPTLKAYYERLLPFAGAFMALFGRNRLPARSTLSRFLAALDQATVEALRTLFQEDLVARKVFACPGGLWDRVGQQFVVVDVDGTRQAARQRALPHLESLPEPHRRFDQVAAAGYLGRKRGEVLRTRTTVLQAHTHQWMGTYSGAGNGDYRGELKRAIQTITSYATALSLPLSQMLVRLDGLYGNAAPLTDVLSAGLGLIGRSKDYGLLDLPAVKAALAHPPVEVCTHPESGTSRALFDCPQIPLGPAGPRVRLIVAAHPASSSPPAIGVEREGMVYELFVTALPSPAFGPKDVLDLYLHRGSFETVLADEDSEQDPDRWCSHSACGQEFWQILSQWMWNLRLELGQHLSASAMRTTEFAPAREASPVPAPELVPLGEPVPAAESVPPLMYGPAQWARPSFTGGFPGSAFTLQPDGTLLCPADHPLYPQERRPERDGSYRLVYAARIGHCHRCPLRAQCQESSSTTKPRRVSAVFWPLSSAQAGSSAPVVGPAQPLVEVAEPLAHRPVLWHDWPRAHIRRSWLKLVRTQTVMLTMAGTPKQEQAQSSRQPVLTRAERAHWRLSWEERLARNARPATSPHLTLTIHGLPATFASVYGFDLRAA
jgi:ketosteroid isomerase-like protein